MKTGNELDDIFENGTEEEIEAALAELDLDGGDQLEGEDSSLNSELVVTDKAEVETDVNTEQANSNTQAKTDVEPESSTEASEQSSGNKGGFIEVDGKFYVEATDVASKNGQHSLPYQVLVDARERAHAAEEARKQLAEEKSEIERQYEETKQLAELHTQQLSEAGIDARKLPKQMLEDPELLERIKDEYPELGEMVGALAEQMREYKTSVQSHQQATSKEEAVNEVQAALDKSTDLKLWRTNDQDKWDMARAIDEKLANDPSFENKPVAERLLEVEKRVKEAFGEQHQRKQESPPPAAIPNSPTDLGMQGSDLSANASLLDSDPENLTDQMSTMSEAQIEALLAEASDVF